MATHGCVLTTHVGCLPRPDDLIAMMWAREDGIPVDRAAMEARVCRAVDEVVARQTKVGGTGCVEDKVYVRFPFRT